MLAVGELARNLGDWQYWASWLVDFIAAALLLAGAIATLRSHRLGERLLAGAWGFTSAMFYGSFWSHIQRMDEPVSGNIDHGPLTVIIGVMWVLTLVGFALALFGRSRNEGPTAR